MAKYNNGPGTTSQAVAMALDKDGNIYVAGHSTRTNAPFDFDYVVIKYNPLGVQQWANRYGTAGFHDQVRAMVVNTNGEVFLTGTGDTVKYLPSGLLGWSAPYAGRDIAADSNGNAYVTGFLTNDFSTVKIAASGTNIWLKTWDRMAMDDRSQAIAIDNSGGVFVGGMATSTCDQHRCYQEAHILKYDANGTLMWTNVLERGQYSFATEFYGFACDAQGNLYLAVAELGFGVPFSWRTAEIASTGQRVWTKLLNSTGGGEGVRAMALDANANLYYSGSRRTANFDRYYQSYKITGTGTDIWETTYLGTTPGFHRGNAIAADYDGNAYVTGQSTGIGTGNDYATIKYGTNGAQLWVKRFTEAGNSDDQAQAIAVSPSGDVYVTGFSNPTNGLYEITTIKYVQVAPIEKKSDGAIRLQFCGTPGSNYTIQACATLTNWTNLGATTANANGLYTFEDTNAPAYPQRFYRTLQE